MICIKGCILLSLILFFSNCRGQVENESNTEKAIDLSTKLVDTPKLIKIQNSQMSDKVNSILEDKNGNLWFGTTGEGVYAFDGKEF